VYEISEEDQPPALEQVDLEKERQSAAEEKSAEVKA
jgi:hypothetical protein